MLLARRAAGAPRRPPSAAPVSASMGSVLGLVVGPLAAVLADLLGARQAPQVGAVLFVAAVAALAAVTTLTGGLAAAAQCWAFWDGFVINGLGRLDLHGGGWRGLALLLLCAAVAHLAAAAARSLHGRRRGIGRGEP